MRACSERDDFKWLRGGLDPCDQTLLNVLVKGEELITIWIAVLQAMHREGHIDLSVILEDGTKMRANASGRSFLTAERIQKRIGELKVLLEKKREKMLEATQLDRKERAQVQAVQGQLKRAGACASRPFFIGGGTPCRPGLRTLCAGDLPHPAGDGPDRAAPIADLAPAGEDRVRRGGTGRLDEARGAALHHVSPARTPDRGPLEAALPPAEPWLRDHGRRAPEPRSA